MTDTAIRSFGYRYDLERRNQLEIDGHEPEQLLKAFRATFPPTNPEANPLGVFDILNQGNVGSCQGHALAGIFSICYFLATGRREHFSRACGYYIAQRYDGINGDNGSTLSGGNKVATEHGMCLEKDWPYTGRYEPREPTGLNYLYKLKRSKPLRTLELVKEWRDAGLPIQTGMSWGNAADREVVDNWSPGGGGHSTVFWQRTPGGNTRMLNSWGSWMADGMNEWSDNAITQLLRHSWTELIGYAPDEMSFPIPDPIT